MGCPHSSGGSRRERDGVDRRDFLLSAVAIGGASALAACIDREADEPATGDTNGNGTDDDGSPGPGNGADNGGENGDPTPPPVPTYRHLERAEGQHAWNRFLARDEHDVPQPPRHHVVVLADLAADGVPTAADRETVTDTLQMLEDAYEWSNEGLLFTVGYSPAYFDRFETTLPPEVDLPEPTSFSALDEPELDHYDVAIHLASDYAQAVLGAEEALFGGVGEIQGVPVEATLEDVLEKQERRTGFIGAGLPAENQDVSGIPDGDPVPEAAPLFMGFETQHTTLERHPFHGETEDTFVHNQNSEYGVMIKEGRFRGGTTQHVSQLRLDLEEWYEDHTLEDRMKRMFEVQAPLELVGDVGQEAREAFVFDDIESDIEAEGRVGHAEKVARARVDGVPRILRRDFNTIDTGHAGVHFVSLQEGITDFVETRTMMDGQDLASRYDGIETRQNNGILEFVTAERRANFLIPPPELRALPRPQ